MHAVGSREIGILQTTPAFSRRVLKGFEECSQGQANTAVVGAARGAARRDRRAAFGSAENMSRRWCNRTNKWSNGETDS